MRVLFIREGGLGDVVVCFPSLSFLAEQADRLTVCMPGSLGGLCVRVGLAHAALRSDGTACLDLFADSPDPSRLSSFLAAFDTVAAVSREDEPISRNLASCGSVRYVRLNQPSENINLHASDQLLRQIHQAFPSATVHDGTQPVRHPRSATFSKGASDESAHAQPYVLIHPGSGSAGKNWPAESFLAVFLRLSRAHPVRILLGPAETETLSFWQHAAGMDCIVQCADIFSLPAILSASYLFIGNDSGVSHLAAYLGIPTVAIFGPTDPRVWAPRGPSVRIAYQAQGCSPCSREQRAFCSARTCLLSITPEYVILLAREVLDGKTGHIP